MLLSFSEKKRANRKTVSVEFVCEPCMVALPLNGSITDTGPGLRFDRYTPAFGDMCVGDITEDGDFDLGVDGTTDGSVVWESDFDRFSYGHLCRGGYVCRVRGRME